MIHHITAICASAERTALFYTKVLGLRLVKLTINQDDIGTYHIYFGDKTGRPGTALTFFQWSDLPKGKPGPGMVSKVAFSVPTLAFWEERLKKLHVAMKKETRFGKSVLGFSDPDGLELELVEHGKAGNWAEEVPKEYAISGFYGATLMLEDYEETGELLTKHLGYSKEKSEGNLHRYVSKETVIDLQEAPDTHPGIAGLGTAHHIAFRSKDKETQLSLREKLKIEGFHPTPSIDRYYFRSVYFREPGNVLFEIATDGPGFTVDETEEKLGSKLVLPPAFEFQRKEIEMLLPPFSFSKLN